jgi:hypothetical protein
MLECQGTYPKKGILMKEHKPTRVVGLVMLFAMSLAMSFERCLTIDMSSDRFKWTRSRMWSLLRDEKSVPVGDVVSIVVVRSNRFADVEISVRNGDKLRFGPFGFSITDRASEIHRCLMRAIDSRGHFRDMYFPNKWLFLITTLFLSVLLASALGKIELGWTDGDRKRTWKD